MSSKELFKILGAVVLAALVWFGLFTAGGGSASKSPLAQYRAKCNAAGGVVVEFLEDKTTALPGGRQYNRTCIDPKVILDVK